MALDIEKYRKRLIQERDKLNGEITKTDMAEIAEQGSDNVEITAADAPAISEGTDIEAAIINLKSDRLEKIEAALQSIDAGTYGKCSVDGKDIEPKRLDAEPTATTCIEHSRAVEGDFEAPQM